MWGKLVERKEEIYGILVEETSVAYTAGRSMFVKVI